MINKCTQHSRKESCFEITCTLNIHPHKTTHSKIKSKVQNILLCFICTNKDQSTKITSSIKTEERKSRCLIKREKADVCTHTKRQHLAFKPAQLANGSVKPSISSQLFFNEPVAAYLKRKHLHFFCFVIKHTKLYTTDSCGRLTCDSHLKSPKA